MSYRYAIVGTCLVVAAIILGGGVYVSQTAAHFERDTRTIVEAQRTLLLIEHILSATKDAETGQRGYVLTGDEAYLQPYSTATRQLDSLLGLLRTKLEHQTPAHTRLQSLVTDKLSELAETVRLRRERGFAAAQSVVANNQGKHLMDSIRSTCQQIQGVEEQRTQRYIADSEAYIQLNKRNVFVGVIVLLCTFIVIASLLLWFTRFRERSLHALREQQGFTDTLLNTVPILVYVYDFQQESIVYTNSFFEELIGHSVSDLNARGLSFMLTLVHPDDVQAVDERSLATMMKDTTSVVHEREYRLRRGDGWRWIVERTAVLRWNERGEAQQFIAFVIDITARIEAEAERRRSQEFLESVVNAASYGIVVAEAVRNEQGDIIDFKYVLVNHLAQQGFGRSLEEIYRSSMLALYPNVIPSGQFEQYCAVVNSGNNAIFDVEYKGEGFDNWFTNVCSKLNDGIVVMYYDITAQKAAEQQIRDLNVALAKKNIDLEQTVAERTAQIQRANQDLQAANQQLEATNKELEAFSYSISHDLRAPLRTINGFADMLRERYEPHFDDEALRLLGKIMNGAQKMGVLIDELLALSRLGRKAMVMADVDMNLLVNAVVAELNAHNELEAYTIEIASLHQALGDAALLRQVWVNLLSNAVKYSRTSTAKTISVTSFVQEQSVVYAVRDMGVGFDMRYADKLFQVFQRLHKERDFEGTGVGLAIVNRIITKHGGYVWAEAALNEGATFCFSLPRDARVGE